MKKKGIIMQIDALSAIITVLILSAVVLISGSGILTSSRVGRAQADTTTLGGYISEYKFEIGKYPDTLDSLTKKVGQYGPWITEIPKDPWGNTYCYKKTDTKFVVYSLGEDKSESGSSAENGIANGDIGFFGK